MVIAALTLITLLFLGPKAQLALILVLFVYLTVKTTQRTNR